ncbi:hypothetical protein SISSUDRAFT_1052910 [Sistotremastrum suecicum HHB10207 ss-3]|uniref:Uncharacterized protein n=1 Tax=Sistotremastrum suecicum HHB10207 ss-3 TaxID=1314776 RepID=A0A165ZJI8_9AGAM|nr:hypothetical protein SISSUDRAFT_1052910 [Sistotremastrum suecicum HHB10207 ss-3]
MTLENGWYTIQNAYSSGFLQNALKDGVVLTYTSGIADENTVSGPYLSCNCRARPEDRLG